jgi:hypothetical protein
LNFSETRRPSRRGGGAAAHSDEAGVVPNRHTAAKRQFPYGKRFNHPAFPPVVLFSSLITKLLYHRYVIFRTFILNYFCNRRLEL